MSIFIYDDERKFKTIAKDGKEITLKIVKPNQKQISEADLRYKTKFAQALRDGAMTRAQAEKIIRDKNILDSDTIERRDQISTRLLYLRSSLNGVENSSKGLEIISEINRLKEELENINSLTLDIMNNTAEAYAEDFRLQWLTSVLTFTEDGEKYFEDYEDFSNYIESTAALDSAKTLILFINNLKENFELEFDENKWLLDQKIINSDGSINTDNLPTDDGDKESRKSKVTKKKVVKKKAVKKATKKKKTSKKATTS